MKTNLWLKYTLSLRPFTIEGIKEAPVLRIVGVQPVGELLCRAIKQEGVPHQFGVVVIVLLGDLDRCVDRYRRVGDYLLHAFLLEFHGVHLVPPLEGNRRRHFWRIRVPPGEEDFEVLFLLRLYLIIKIGRFVSQIFIVKCLLRYSLSSKFAA